jgi:hypothetical protein
MDCKKDESIDLIRDDIKEIRKDVRQLLEFRWQVMGGGIVAGFFGSIIVAVLVSYMNKQL